MKALRIGIENSPLNRSGFLWIVMGGAILSLPPAFAQSNRPTISFTSDIQPILANHCYSCHGPDEASRESGLRLDRRENALAGNVIVPHEPSRSLLIERAMSHDPDLQMPPPSHKRPLSEQQKELLKNWISQGAVFAEHWAFVPPSRAKYLEIQHNQTIGNPIDHLIQTRLEQENLPLASEADRSTLLRRVTLDLTGLPPSPLELEQFLQDPRTNAYELVVDRLLASESYAERMTMEWLDLARYADTNGYNNDEDRTMWPWRDWVIHAFHTNMPYDKFIVQQLAGDLLNEPIQAAAGQLPIAPRFGSNVATAFLRNQGHNTEGGIIQEEYRVEYVADRVHTASTVFLGLSMQCARCHDHKYDPISQSEYYQFYAFFNNLDEKQSNYNEFKAAVPFVRVASLEQSSSLEALEAGIAGLQESLEARQSQSGQLVEQWVADHSIEELEEQFSYRGLHHFSMEHATDATGLHLTDTVSGASVGHSLGALSVQVGKVGQAIELDGGSHYEISDAASFDGAQPFAIGAWIYPTAEDSMAIFSRMDESQSYRGFDLLIEQGKLVSHLIHRWPDNAIKVSTQQPIELNKWQHVVLTYAGGRLAAGLRIYVDGKAVPLDTLSDSLTETIATPKPFHIGLRETTLAYRGMIDELMIFQGSIVAEQVAQWFTGQPMSRLIDIINKSAVERTAQESQQLSTWFLTHIDRESIRLCEAIDQKEAEKQQLTDSFAAVMVMRDMENPRETFVLHRGQYDQPREKVSAGLPKLFNVSTATGKQNRLTLANWLVEPTHPLTARVAVNRWWQHYFGTGIVKTVEDFGLTGEAPSHPELLDYLALTFIDSGWDVKALQKLIVMSATYRQISSVTAEQLAADPENRWLSRGPRFRLAAETVRDNALAISGLLRQRVGGPSVRPYQPAGLWEDVSVERRAKYIPDEGEGLYRRSMYTFWKRTCPPPAMMNFDAPNREVCFARRPRTNTPLQSLVLLNDPTYVEAARMLAQLMLRSDAISIAGRIQFGFRRCLAREATLEELKIVEEILVDAQQRFRNKPPQATAFNQIGFTEADAAWEPVELAAWTIVASTLLNLDETISKR